MIRLRGKAKRRFAPLLLPQSRSVIARFTVGQCRHDPPLAIGRPPALLRIGCESLRESEHSEL
jgi:hypothetical protein